MLQNAKVTAFTVSELFREINPGGVRGKGGGGQKKVLGFSSEVTVGMFILIPVIGYLCFCVRLFSNSNSNKGIHEKLHLHIWTYLVTEKTVFGDRVSKTQFKIEYSCRLLDLLINLVTGCCLVALRQKEMVDPVRLPISTLLFFISVFFHGN